jgi:hypothetical protein
MKKVIRLNESDIEKLVQKIIREEGEKPKEKETTLTKHPAYSVIDALGKKLEDLKTEFKDGIANAVSGSDGYHSEIDKFSSDFTKFIGKLEDLKTKVNDYQVVDNKRHQEEKAKQMQERKRMMYMAQEKAKKEGRNYSYEKTR